jgi:catechol-2,3-dioxygenase
VGVVAAIASPDTHALAKWYIGTLGFSIQTQSAKSGSYLLKAPNGSMLEIIQSDNSPQAQKFKDAGLRHLALQTDSFDADLASLQSASVKFLTEQENKGGNRVVFFADPDGNILHLIQRESPL